MVQISDLGGLRNMFKIELEIRNKSVFFFVLSIINDRDHSEVCCILISNQIFLNDKLIASIAEMMMHSLKRFSRYREI